MLNQRQDAIFYYFRDLYNPPVDVTESEARPGFTAAGVSAQSNVITLGYFAGALYWMTKRGTTEPPAPRLRGGVTLWMRVGCSSTVCSFTRGSRERYATTCRYSHRG